MPRGGARSGSGRPPGSKSKPKGLLVVPPDFVSTGDELLDLWMMIVRDPTASRQERSDAAAKAAPYRLARFGVRTAPPEENGPRIESIQIVAIPPGCLLTNEQIKNPDLLPMDQAVPVTGLEHMFKGPKRAKVYTPPAPTRTIIGAEFQPAPRVDDEPDDIVA